MQKFGNTMVLWDFKATKPQRTSSGTPGARLDAHGKPDRLYHHMLKLFLCERQGRVREIYSASFRQPDMIYNDIRTLLLEEDATRSARK